MTALKDIITSQIARFGPMSVADYMTLCLMHPDHGYYTTGAPLGRDGDFITAPDISQMFGEMIGLFMAQVWVDQGRPPQIVFAELGPGTGTLMADALRAAAVVPGFLEAADIWLVEVNPALQSAQQDRLRRHKPNWATAIADLPSGPIFVIANEFFDTQPIRQFLRTNQGWRERLIGLEDGELAFGVSPPVAVQTLEDEHQMIGQDQMLETSVASQSLMADIGHRISAQGGVALVVDYGDDGGHGNTFQAVKNHQKVDPLQNAGQVDLTAHVDFAALARACPMVAHSATTPQGVFLERLGISARAQALSQALNGDALRQHIAAHKRLTHPKEMGSLFKAVAFYPKGAPPPPGFSDDA